MKARTWIAGLTSTTLIATVGVVAFGAAPAANASHEVEADAGTVIISTGTTDSIVFDDGNAATTNTVQPLGTSGKCTLTPASGTAATLVSWSANTGVPGYYVDSIGVSSANKTSGTACSQVNKDANEALVLTFNGPKLAGTFGTLRATAASLDVEVKSNARITAQLLDTDGSAIAGEVYVLNTGGSQVPLADVTDANQNCVKGSDSGPDSGPNDNCRWDFNTVETFAGIRLTASVGSFSLEGGGDFGAAASSNRSTFAMVDVADGEFCIGTTKSAVYTGTGTIDYTSSSVTRLPNGDGTEAVSCLLYTLNVGQDGASFRKPVDEQWSAQFDITVVRTFQPPVSNPTSPLEIDWLATPTEIDAIGWCPNAVFDGNEASPTFNYAAATDMAANVDVPNVNDKQYTCLYSSKSVLNGDGTVTQTDKFYLVGDPKYGVY